MKSVTSIKTLQHVTQLKFLKPFSEIGWKGSALWVTICIESKRNCRLRSSCDGMEYLLKSDLRDTVWYTVQRSSLTFRVHWNESEHDRAVYDLLDMFLPLISAYKSSSLSWRRRLEWIWIPFSLFVWDHCDMMRNVNGSFVSYDEYVAKIRCTRLDDLDESAYQSKPWDSRVKKTGDAAMPSWRGSRT